MSIKNLSFIILLVLIILSCKKDGFDTKNSDFQKVYNNLIADGKTEEFTLDTEVHEYTFTLTEDKVLFVIGYKSHPDLKSTDYTIEIIDNSDSSTIYSEEHQFRSNRISYVTPSLPVSFQSGVSYTVRRIQSNWGSNIALTIGELVKTIESDYPISDGIITITESDFTDSDGAPRGHKFFAVPQIDLVFE